MKDFLTDDEMNQLEMQSGGKPSGGFADPAKITQLQSQAAASKREANTPMWKRFFREVPKATKDVVAGNVIKFGQSLSVPLDRTTVKSVQQNQVTAGNSQQQLISTIQREKDPAKRQRLIQHLKTAYGPNVQVPGITDINPAMGFSNKDVLLAAGGTALDIIGAGRATKGVTSSFKLAKGVPSPATQAVTKGAQKTISFLKKTKDVRKLKGALEVTSPVLDKKSSIKAFEAAGRPGGIAEKGITKSYKVQPTARDIEVAESVKNIVSKNKSPVKNLTRVNKEISRISEDEVKPFLRANPKPFNGATLRSRLDTIEPQTIFKADPTIENSYKLVKQRIMEVVEKSNHKKTMEGLWETRKDIDDMMENEFGDAVFNPEKGSAVKRAYLDSRRVINDFIADSTGDGVFKAKMKQLSNMYEARHNLAEKSYRLANSNVFKRFGQNHPVIRKTAKFVAGSGIAGGGIAGASRLFSGGD